MSRAACRKYRDDKSMIAQTVGVLASLAALSREQNGHRLCQRRRAIAAGGDEDLRTPPDDPQSARIGKAAGIAAGDFVGATFYRASR